MLKWLLLQFLLHAAPALTSDGQQIVNVPPELFNLLHEQYPTTEQTMHTKLGDIGVTIKGPGRTQNLKLGITQQTLDLATYVDNRWVDFTLTLKAPFEFNGDEQLFFINRYKPTAGGVPGGLPCGKAVKIKTKLDKLFSTQGIKLMTKGDHYLNLIGGDFLLTQLDGQRFHIVHFKIVDSRKSQRLCHEKF